MYQTMNTTMSLLFSSSYNFSNSAFSVQIGNSISLTYMCIIIIKECSRKNYDRHLKYLLFKCADFLKLISLGAPPGFYENKSDDSPANIGTYSINVQCNTISFIYRLETVSYTHLTLPTIYSV